MQCIQRELLDRLKEGSCRGIYNYPFDKFNDIVELDGKNVVFVPEDEDVSVHSHRLFFGVSLFTCIPMQ
jgi:hypothetical protein